MICFSSPKTPAICNIIFLKEKKKQKYFKNKIEAELETEI